MNGAQGLSVLAADVAFYGGGGLVIAMLGSQPGARAARLPVLALLLGNWASEHWLLNTFQRLAALLLNDRGLTNASLIHRQREIASCYHSAQLSCSALLQQLLLTGLSNLQAPGDG